VVRNRIDAETDDLCAALGKLLFEAGKVDLPLGGIGGEVRGGSDIFLFLLGKFPCFVCGIGGAMKTHPAGLLVAGGFWASCEGCACQCELGDSFSSRRHRASQPTSGSCRNFSPDPGLAD
jgi:hypothetical protein